MIYVDFSKHSVGIQTALAFYNFMEMSYSFDKVCTMGQGLQRKAKGSLCVVAGVLMPVASKTASHTYCPEALADVTGYQWPVKAFLHAIYWICFLM